MRKWLFALVLVSGVARAQDSVFKKYLAQNESRLEHGSAPGWDLLKQDAARSSFWLFLCPVFGFALSNLFTQEPITWFTLVGMALVIGGIYWEQRQARR